MVKTRVAVGLAAIGLLLPACRDEDGRQLDDAMRSVAESTEEALQDISRELDEAVEAGREVARDLGDRAVEAADDAVDAADEAMEKAEDALRDED